jgi:hypothetical protein
MADWVDINRLLSALLGNDFKCHLLARVENGT